MSVNARYRPPALRALVSGGSPPNETIGGAGDGSVAPPANYPPGFRRARAGTLPSNPQLAAREFATTATSLATATATADGLPDQIQRQTSLASAAPARPALRHATTTAVAPPIVASATTTGVPERNSRLRSGSLTLPPRIPTSGGLSNAFGPSLFSTPWMPSSSNGGNSFSVLDELHSVTSGDSGADDFNVHTLDYLGLDESTRPPPAATITELRNQAQATITGNLNGPLRTRASTISMPYRSLQQPSGLMSTPSAEEEDEYFEGYDEMSYGRGHPSAYDLPLAQNDYGQPSYLKQGFKSDLTSNRPRAISVGILDDSSRPMQRRATTSEAQYYSNEYSTPTSNLATHNPSGILKSSDKSPSGRVNVSSSVHFNPSGEIQMSRSGTSPYLYTPTNSGQTRSVSPKSEGPASQIQTPTRSLWIGNLDSAVTSEQLIHVFAPYGAIESLRLLPEKV